jgi:hypothetical protein
MEIERISIVSQHASERIALDSRGLESVWRADEFRVFWRNFQRIYTLAAKDRQPVGVPSANAPEAAPE